MIASPRIDGVEVQKKSTQYFSDNLTHWLISTQARLTVGDLLEDPYLSHYALHEERQTQFRNRTPREKLSKRGSLRGGFAGNSPLARGDGVNTPPSLEKAPSETISELATLQSENATPPPS